VLPLRDEAMSDSAPHVSEELVQYLRARYPFRLVSRTASLAEIQRDAGNWDVVQHLVELHHAQTSAPGEAPPPAPSVHDWVLERRRSRPWGS
jgi:hypothetical protein